MYFLSILPFGLVILPAALAAPFETRACIGPDVNAATIALIKEFEGFVKEPAPDPIGLPTVGYGHLCKTKGCGEVPYSFPLTEATATKLLHDDLKVCSSSLVYQINLPTFCSLLSKPLPSTRHPPSLSTPTSMVLWYRGHSMSVTAT
jgi:hypothetical protein